MTFSLLFIRPVWKKISKDAQDLLKGLLQVDPQLRLSASEAIKHPWITGQAHTNEHLTHLEDAQFAMKTRVEKRAKKDAAAAAGNAAAAH